MIAHNEKNILTLIVDSGCVLTFIILIVNVCVEAVKQ